VRSQLDELRSDRGRSPLRLRCYTTCVSKPIGIFTSSSSDGVSSSVTYFCFSVSVTSYPVNMSCVSEDRCLRITVWAAICSYYYMECFNLSNCCFHDVMFTRVERMNRKDQFWSIYALVYTIYWCLRWWTSDIGSYYFAYTLRYLFLEISINKYQRMSITVPTNRYNMCHPRVFLTHPPAYQVKSFSSLLKQNYK